MDTERNSDFNYLCKICDMMSFPVWQMTLLVKDEESMFSEKVYKVHYYTHFNILEQNALMMNEDQDNALNPGNIQFFFGGQAATNLHENPPALEKIITYIKLLTCFNIHIDAVINKKTLGPKKLFILHDAQLIQLPNQILS